MSQSAAPQLTQATQSSSIRWNYTCHAIEGGFFLGGIAFVAADSVLPPILKDLGAPDWVISFMPQLHIVGFMLPPLLMAHWMERQPKLKSIIMLSGIPQRLVYLAAGILLLLFGTDLPLLAAGAVAIAPLISGFSGGLTYGGWTELVSRTIPAKRRSSLTAIRSLIGASLAACAGLTIKYTLDRYPGATGYAYLHFMTFICMTISFIIFANLREEPQPERRMLAGVSFWQNLKLLPGIFKRDKSFANYILARLAGATMFTVVPFASMHVLEVTERPNSFLGLLVTLQTTGTMAGNVIGGYLGDRYGGKIVLMMSRTSFICAYTLIGLGTTTPVFFTAYVLLGAGFSLNMIGHGTLMLELSPDDKRPTYVGLASTINAPALIGAGVLAWYLRTLSTNIVLPAAASIAGLALSLYFVWRIVEPRKQTLCQT